MAANYQCPQCDASFCDEELLRLHEMNRHAKERLRTNEADAFVGMEHGDL